MTWLQALVALALFAPGAVAPSAHLDIPSLSMFSTAVFAVGVFTSFWTGGLINRLGSLRMASLCAGAVVASMAFAAFGSGSALLLAGLCLGLAFGPETPASTALLGKLVTDERRALVFSLRQTGNQIGAVCGSLALPAIAIWLAPQWSYAAVAACAICGIVAFEWLRPRYEGMAQALPQLGMRARLALVSSDRRIAALAAASMPSAECSSRSTPILSRSVYANSGSAISKPVPHLPVRKPEVCWGGSDGDFLRCASVPQDWF
jgi:MFS family permease